MPRTPAATRSRKSRKERVLKGFRALGAEPTTRTRIVIGAMQAFRDKSLTDATVEDILQAAGVSRGTFYQYFRNKEDVMAELFAYSTRLLVERVQAEVAAVNEPFRKIERAVDVYLQLQLEDGKLVHALLAESMRPESRIGHLREWAIDTMVAFIDESVVAAQGRRLDPLVYRTLLLGVEALIMHVQAMGEFTPADAEHVRRVVTPIIVRTMALPDETLPELPGVRGGGRKRSVRT